MPPNDLSKTRRQPTRLAVARGAREDPLTDVTHNSPSLYSLPSISRRSAALVNYSSVNLFPSWGQWIVYKQLWFASKCRRCVCTPALLFVGKPKCASPHWEVISDLYLNPVIDPTWLTLCFPPPTVPVCLCQAHRAASLAAPLAAPLTHGAAGTWHSSVLIRKRQTAGGWWQ